MASATARRQWPIRPRIDGGGFIVEDDQGYNFSFPTRQEAEDFRDMCEVFNEELAERELEIVQRFRDSLRA